MCILITRGGVSYVKKKEKQGPLNITTKKKGNPVKTIGSKADRARRFFFAFVATAVHIN